MFEDLIDFWTKIIAFLAVIFWQLYWWYTERIADREKPKTAPPSFIKNLNKAWPKLVGLIFFLQLLGLNILPFQRTIEIQITGLLLVLVGVGIGVSARNTLGTNWTHATEYQIKKNHDLVTDGVYAYIRHPIYVSLMLVYIGFEFILHSYLFILLGLIMFISAYIQGRKEEKLLQSHFGNKYMSYMKKSKMLIPFIF